MEHKDLKNQVAQAPAGVVLLALVATYLLVALFRKYGALPVYVLIVLGFIGGSLWLMSKRDDTIRLEPLDPPHVLQLREWCTALSVDMPRILKHEYTDTGEMYWLRVTGNYTNDMGHRGVMTPEMFYSFWPKFRAVAGDNCRGVFISKPDPRHGGRCTMNVVWTEKEQEDNPWPVPVLITGSSIRMCYSDKEVEAARREAESNGFVDPAPAWAAPNPAERVGEG